MRILILPNLIVMFYIRILVRILPFFRERNWIKEDLIKSLKHAFEAKKAYL